MWLMVENVSILRNSRSFEKMFEYCENAALEITLSRDLLKVET